MCNKKKAVTIYCNRNKCSEILFYKFFKAQVI